jgi:hypothetical protein
LLLPALKRLKVIGRQRSTRQLFYITYNFVYIGTSPYLSLMVCFSTSSTSLSRPLFIFLPSFVYIVVIKIFLHLVFFAFMHLHWLIVVHWIMLLSRGAISCYRAKSTTHIYIWDMCVIHSPLNECLHRTTGQWVTTYIAQEFCHYFCSIQKQQLTSGLYMIHRLDIPIQSWCTDAACKLATSKQLQHGRPSTYSCLYHLPLFAKLLSF